MVLLLQSNDFYGVARVASLQLDWSLISAIVEKWWPETHTFHLPVGEVTITLRDVGVLFGLPVDGDVVISDVTPGPDMSWASYVGEIFGSTPVPKKDMNGLRTDHSRGLFHPIFLHFFRDLDKCGDYAWGAAMLAYLYRELYKIMKKEVDEVVGCLILLQLWAWERLPTLAPIHTTVPLFDARFWEGQPTAPRELMWLYGHSHTTTGGHTLPVIQTLLDGFGPSQFIWQPYPLNVIVDLPTYCLIGEPIWRYC
ncbi:serine/threonine-protein phosphatase 7 long form homolog [Apium graveolens]|uniref:serine/threonine-protein phosphatase 7 long form homolog n=1 Tax=Apium graveolens TaxID=4045 RepID=UPI003D79C527